MMHDTFAVEGREIASPRFKRETAKAAFDIADVVAVGIDDVAGTVTVTSDRHIGFAEFTAATAAIGFRTTYVCQTRLAMAS